MSDALPFLQLSPAAIAAMCSAENLTHPPCNLIFNPNSTFENYTNSYDPDFNTLCIIPPRSEYHDLLDLNNNAQLSTNFTIVSHNIRSVSKNLESFWGDFHGLVFDLIGFTETRLSDSIESLYRLNSYDMFAKNRNTSGGGALIYVRGCYNARLLREHSYSKPH